MKTNVFHCLEEIEQNLSEYIKKGKFNSEQFCLEFSKKINTILNSVKNTDDRIKLEKDVAWLMKEIQEQTGVQLLQNPIRQRVNQLERRLQEKGVLEDLEKLAQFEWEESGNFLLNDIQDFLRLQSLKTELDSSHVVQYFRTIINFSQQISDSSNVAMILEGHIGESFENVPEQIIEDVVDEYIDIDDDWEVEWLLQYSSDITRDEAYETIEYYKKYLAKVYLFLMYHWQENIRDIISELPITERVLLIDMVNSVRDILDPEFLVPLFFSTENPIENTIRDEYMKKGVTLQ